MTDFRYGYTDPDGDWLEIDQCPDPDWGGIRIRVEHEGHSWDDEPGL